MTRLGPVFIELNGFLVPILVTFSTVFQSLVLQAIYSSVTFLPGIKPVVNCVTPKRRKSGSKKTDFVFTFFAILNFG